MRKSKVGKVLAMRAISGLEVVTLAWDFVAGKEDKRKGLLGFAIERAEFDDSGKEVERYYLRASKRFKGKDRGVPAGVPVPTSEHPIQSFQWGDYSAQAGATYEYRIVPAYGEPKRIKLDESAAVAVRISAETETSQDDRNAGTCHDVYFNRGAAGSQHYANRFGKTKPDEHDPISEQMVWLSRGLFEALTGFIRLAAGPDAKDYALRAALYEFKYAPVGQAFKDAKNAGADVDIRYEASSYKDHNEEMIAEAKIKQICKPQKARDGIRHNKFIVLIHNEDPIAVWTGSTNISAGGIFGHSNVGHIIWDREVAAKFLEYWTDLASADVSRGALVEANIGRGVTPTLGKLPPKNRSLSLFSPRDEKGEVATLHWYADLMRQAKQMVCMTFAFNLDDIYKDILAEPGKVLRYAVFDDKLDSDTTRELEAIQNTVIAAGAKLKKGDLENFIAENLSGFNKNCYIHNKFILIDPLGDDPIVITGSANFSAASQVKNDENMLVIRGDKRVADIYFGEFMRVFDHLYSRYLIGILAERGVQNPEAGYLKDSDSEWVSGHFKKNGRKALRRAYFLGISD
jgi:phosphatidylserine/phosphatidylglycerophosphate/cardiolipin synthase-like enzyme